MAKKLRKPKVIKSVDELRKSIKDEHYQYYIQLNLGIISRKDIELSEDGKKFIVINNIDDSKQRLTDKQIMDPNYTNIGEAMKKKAFFVEFIDED